MALNPLPHLCYHSPWPTLQFLVYWRLGNLLLLSSYHFFPSCKIYTVHRETYFLWLANVWISVQQLHSNIVQLFHISNKITEEYLKTSKRIISQQKVSTWLFSNSNENYVSDFVILLSLYLRIHNASSFTLISSRCRVVLVTLHIPFPFCSSQDM